MKKATPSIMGTVRNTGKSNTWIYRHKNLSREYEGVYKQGISMQSIFSIIILVTKPNFQS